MSWPCTFNSGPRCFYGAWFTTGTPSLFGVALLGFPLWYVHSAPYEPSPLILMPIPAGIYAVVVLVPSVGIDINGGINIVAFYQ